MAHPMAVPQSVANTPRPKPPDNVVAQDWLNYLDDLACWIAMKADVISFGIVEGQ